MPPKPKSPAKGKAKDQPVETGPAPDTVDERVAKELQVVDLQDKLDRSKQELDVLATVNTKLTAESAHSKADLHDINEYLCNQLKATALTNATLSSRIDDLEHRLLETSRAHTDELARGRREAEAAEAEAAATIQGLEEQVQRAQTFLEAEAGLQVHVQNVEMRANTIKAECEERIREVERQAVAFKERMRKENIAAVRQAEQEARSKVEGQSLSMGQLTATLHAQAAQVKQLLDEVERVKGLEAARRREAELLRGSEAALLAKGALYRQAITVLTGKLKQTKQQQHPPALSSQHQPRSNLLAVPHGPNQGRALHGPDRTDLNKGLGEAQNELADVVQELKQLKQAEAVRLSPERMSSLSECIGSIVEDRVSAALSSPPSSGARTGGARLTLFERNQIEGCLQPVNEAPEAAAAGDMPGLEGLSLSLAALDMGPLEAPSHAEPGNDSAPSFRRISATDIFQELLEGPASAAVGG